MRHTNNRIRTLICSLIIAAVPLFGGVKLQVREGRPIVDGVYVNGHGPYRFLVDTGTNVNLIETGLVRKMGMQASFQVEVGSAAGKTTMAGSDGNEVGLDEVKAGGQKFLFSELEAIHHHSPDVQGVLGQWFLFQFDYMLDLRGKRLEFGKHDRNGTRTRFKTINARPVVSTSLGDLALDSGTTRVVLFGVRPDTGSGSELRTVAGSQNAGVVFGKPLIVEGRRIWRGDVVAIPNRAEPGVDGLMPLGLFKTIYVCNSEGYVVFE